MNTKINRSYSEKPYIVFGDDGGRDFPGLEPIFGEQKKDSIMTRQELSELSHDIVNAFSISRNYNQVGNFISETIHNVIAK